MSKNLVSFKLTKHLHEAYCWHDSTPKPRKDREERREIYSFEPDPRTTCDGSRLGVHFRKRGNGWFFFMRGTLDPAPNITVACI